VPGRKSDRRSLKGNKVCRPCPWQGTVGRGEGDPRHSNKAFTPVLSRWEREKGERC
jgi:hypothetical protein